MNVTPAGNDGGECGLCHSVYAGCEKCSSSSVYSMFSKEFTDRETSNPVYIKCDRCRGTRFLDTKISACVTCTSKYGLYCKSCDEKVCLSCRAGSYLTSSKKTCQRCYKVWDNCAKCTSDKCLECNKSSTDMGILGCF